MKDPVCLMDVEPAAAAGSHRHEGRDYYFCSVWCRDRFAADPAAYLTVAPGAPPAAAGTAAAGGTGAPAAGAARYTCPMHPEIRSDRPGACPICGMALEPAAIDLGSDEPAFAELADMTRRFWIGLALTVPVFALGMAGMLPVAQFALATPVVLYCGWPFFERAWASLVHRSLNMFTLIGIGTGAAYAYSFAAMLAPGAHHVYFESAAVITVLVLLGQVLELRARARTTGAIRALLHLAPKTARLVRDDGTEAEVEAGSVRPGERVRVRPGERVPADGVVIEGEAWIDESMVTGEPAPVRKGPGDRVTGGTVGTTGSGGGAGALIIRAERVGAETLLAQIVRMVSEAQRTRAPIQRLADRVSAWFVPAVVATAALTFLVWGLAGPEPRLAHAMVNAVAVLIIACPCALGLATPMSIMVGTGRGAASGVLIRDAEALEVLENVDTLVVDKTGTLTEGHPRLVAAEGDPSLLALAAGLESSSEHPIATAIVAGAAERGLRIDSPGGFESLSGMGVTGSVSGALVALGNRALMERHGVNVDAFETRAGALRRDGATVVYAAVDGRPAGILAVADPVKPTAAEAVAALHREGLRIVMMTGDVRATAEAVARQLGIDEVRAGVLPQEKAQGVRRLREEGRIVTMAGDGINDAPALAAAHVGIAMGSGTDVAMESAGVTLVKGDLRGIVRARRLSRATMRNIRQNLFFAFVYNTLGVPIAAGVLYPFLGVLLSPMIASAAMSFSSVSVVANALRLRKAVL